MAKYCDLCGKEQKPNKFLYALNSEYQTPELHDVCEDCMTEITDFLVNVDKLKRRMTTSIVRRFIARMKPSGEAKTLRGAKPEVPLAEATDNGAPKPEMPSNTTVSRGSGWWADFGEKKEVSEMFLDSLKFCRGFACSVEAQGENELAADLRRSLKAIEKRFKPMSSVP